MFKIAVVNKRAQLEFLAFGVRHHPKSSHAPNVYDLAGERVAEITATDLRTKK